MASFKLIITDHNETFCTIKDCGNIANQVQVVVTKNKAKVYRVCWKHHGKLPSPNSKSVVGK
jgi:hypothetical protein